MPMTIAYVINQYPQTSQSFIRREIAALETAGVRVERFTLRRGSDPLVEERDLLERQRTRCVLDAGAWGLMLGVLRVLFTKPRAFLAALILSLQLGWHGDRGVGIHLVYLAEACVLLQWLNQCGAQHVHAHFGTNSTTVPMLCRLLGGPACSFTVHGPEEFDRPQAIALGEKIRRAAFVVAISHFGQSQLFRWCAYEDWPKIHVIHCGVDELFLAGNSAAMPRTNKLVCIGRLAEQKGQLLLLQAAEKLSAEKVDFELVLIGDGPMRSALEERIARGNLHSRVRLAGWMASRQVRREILDSRAVVLASFAEGLPVVIMEAMALRRPVIATAVAGIPELVEPGISGWLVPAGSADDLACAMRQALEAGDEQLMQMGKAAAAKVAKQHNASVEAGKLAELFRQTIGIAKERTLPTPACPPHTAR